MPEISFSVEDRRKRGYFTVDNVLLDIYGQQLGPHGIAVYCALARFANKEQEAWPTYRTISERTRVSRSQIIRAITRMEGLKIITITRRVDDKGNRTSHLYTLLDIIGGGSTVEPGGDSYQEPASTRVEPRTKPIKKYIPKEKEGKKNYRPDEYSDIILG